MIVVSRVRPIVEEVDNREEELAALVDEYEIVAVHLPEWAYTKYEWYNLLMMKQRLRKKITALKKELSKDTVQ